MTADEIAACRERAERYSAFIPWQMCNDVPALCDALEAAEKRAAEAISERDELKRTFNWPPSSRKQVEAKNEKLLQELRHCYNDLEAAERKLADIAALHCEDPGTMSSSCIHDCYVWPCKTRRIIDGESA